MEKEGLSEVVSHRDFLDVSVGSLGLYATLFISGPAGWFVGAGVLVYVGSTIIWDATHPTDE